MASTQDRGSILQDISRRATCYGINLNEWVQRGTLRSTGSFSLVYDGTLQPQGMKVVIKTARSNSLEYKACEIDKALHEVHLWSTLRHGNIVSLLGIVTAFDHTVSIVSQWMGNGNAYEYVQDRQIDPRPLLLGIAKGLEYLHSRQPDPVYHGDLKGRNVLISREGRALLTDFGLSRLANTSFRLSPVAPARNSLPWLDIETMDAAEYAITREADIWAFAMTALELFTRERPFGNFKTDLELLYQILRGPPDRPTAEVTQSRLTDEWWTLCTQCWNRELQLRPQMSSIATDIQRIMDMEVATAFAELRAACSSVNIDGQVERGDLWHSGDIAHVYDGIWLSQGTRVSVHTICPDPQVALKVLKDIPLVWSKARHENIVSFVGIITTPNEGPSVVSDWLGRRNAHDHVQDRSVDPRPLFRGIAEGLSYLHAHAIFHGNLNGENVLITEDGRPLLTGFGLYVTPHSFPTTHALDWTAPEVLSSPKRVATAKADVWGYGVIVWELFTGKLPFHGSNDVEHPTQLDRPTPESTCSRMTDTWWQLCQACTVPRPSHRPDMSEVIERMPKINIVLFGESGARKGSVVNLIAGKQVAKASDAYPSTMATQKYEIQVNGLTYHVYDTIGLEKPHIGWLTYPIVLEKAFELIKLLDKGGGVHLLLFCMRGGQITATAQNNYRLFFEFFCDKKVPVKLVVTDLEDESQMEDWYTRNEANIINHGLRSYGHACIAAAREPRDPVQDAKYMESRESLLRLCAEAADGWKMEKRNDRFQQSWLILWRRYGMDAEVVESTAGMNRTVGQLAPWVSRCAAHPIGVQWMAHLTLRWSAMY